MMIVSVAGFIVTLVLNAFFLDKYNAYGEVSVPGASRLHLPAGEVTISLHTVVIGGRDVVRDGVHLLVPDVPAELSRTIRAVLG